MFFCYFCSVSTLLPTASLQPNDPKWGPLMKEKNRGKNPYDRFVLSILRFTDFLYVSVPRSRSLVDNGDVVIGRSSSRYLQYCTFEHDNQLSPLNLENKSTKLFIFLKDDHFVKYVVHPPPPSAFSVRTKQ